MNSQELEVGLPSDVGGVFAALSTLFTVQADAPHNVTYTYVDTVDWRLHRAGLALRDARRARTGELVLDSIDASRITTPARPHGWPSRADRLPASPVRDLIADAAGMRALLPLAEVEARCIPLRLLDAEQKTRVRIVVEQPRLVRPRKCPLPLRLIISPLRGYDRDADKCVSLLKESLGATFEPGSTAVTAFTAAGRTPADAIRGPIVLSPDDPISRSVAIVLRRWLTVLETNRDGVVADLDPEFLNELRGAIAASRALLDVMGDVLPGDTAPHTADRLAWLSTLTARTQDLDRCVADFSGEGRFALDDLSGLEPLREHVLRSRRSELRQLRTELQSDRMATLLSSWRAALDDVARAEVLGPRTVSVAGARLRRAHGALAAADVADLDALRRRCARMRYVLQSFACLYDADCTDRVLADLGDLQAHLDIVQDVSMQSTEITTTALRLRKADAQSLLAMGALRDRGEAYGREVGRELPRQLDDVRTGPTAALFAALLGDTA